jgi:ribosomal protein L1
MAKRFVESTQPSDKAKVRIVFAELEGSNESVQEALRTMVAAMARPAKVVVDAKLEGRTEKAAELNSIEHTDEDEIEDVETEPHDSKVSAATRAPRGSGKKVDRNAGLAWVPDLNFRPVGEVSLKEFAKGKNPTNDQEYVLVTLHYMQNVMKLSKIGPSHVMTAFKEVSRKIPADIRQAIRNTKNSQIWLDFTEIEELRTTTQGDNQIEHEMGKGE